MPELPLNGRNGKTAYLAISVSVLMSLVALGKTVFFAGGSEGKTEEHIRYIDMRLDVDERGDNMGFVRRGELQAEIETMREIQRGQEQTLQEIKRAAEEDQRYRRNH